MQTHKTSSKYNKVNQQKKFYLLSLIYKQHLPIREAASTVGINYLTAKTIVFFYKNNYKSYQFDIENTHQLTQNYATASFTNIKRVNAINQKIIRPKSRIEVVCSIGNVLSPPRSPESTLQGSLPAEFGRNHEKLPASNVEEVPLQQMIGDWPFFPSSPSPQNIEQLLQTSMHFSSVVDTLKKRQCNFER